MKKIYHPDGSLFLIRFIRKCGNKGSIKLHIIWNDDIKPHTHPWDFKSFILFGGYIEDIQGLKMGDDGEIDYTLRTEYGWLSVNRKKINEMHQVRLRRFLGIRIPAITIGFYGPKKQLCSLCKELGYCKSSGKPL